MSSACRRDSGVLVYHSSHRGPPVGSACVERSSRECERRVGLPTVARLRMQASEGWWTRWGSNRSPTSTLRRRLDARDRRRGGGTHRFDASGDTASVTRKSSSRSACSRRPCCFTSRASSISEAISSSFEARRSRVTLRTERRALCGWGVVQQRGQRSMPALGRRSDGRVLLIDGVREIVALNRVGGDRHTVEMLDRVADRREGDRPFLRIGDDRPHG